MGKALLRAGIVLALSLLLSACGAAAQPTAVAVVPEQTPAASAEPVETPTVLPTLEPSATSTPTSTATAAATATALPTARATVTLAQDTVLYSGPGNQGYQAIATLKAGSSVVPIGTYGDFVQVEAQGEGGLSTGFALQTDVGAMPPGLAGLGSDQVPWQPVDVVLNFFDRAAFVDNDTITVDNAGYDGYYDYHGRPFTFESAFQITVRLQTTDKQYGSLKLQDQPNSASEKWWEGIRRLDIATDGHSLSLEFKDGTKESSSAIRLNTPDSQVVTITFLDPNGKALEVRDGNGRRLKFVDLTKLTWLDLPDGLFPERRVYIGCVVSPLSKLTISSLALQAVPSGTWSTAETDPRAGGLRELAKQRGVTIGTEFSWWYRENAAYWAIMSKDFDVAVLSEFSSKSFWQGRGKYNFEWMDHLVDWSLRAGWRVRASHLVWGAYESGGSQASGAIPDWLLASSYSREEFVEILKEHVTTVVGHFKGRVAEWSIANEATSRSFYQSGADFWNDKIGPEYIEIAFRAAREADPASVLIFNDDNNQAVQDEVTERVVGKMYATVKDLKSMGVPIDAVGMQMHLLLPWNSQAVPNKDDVIQTMQRFADLGVDIYITEFDVNLDGRQGTAEERWEFEAGLYRDVVEACLESGVCKSFTTWGVADSTSWITCMDDGCVKLPDADPLMFDKGFQPKPAYHAVREALSGE